MKPLLLSLLLTSCLSSRTKEGKYWKAKQIWHRVWARAENHSPIKLYKMPMSEETKKILREKGREDLIEIKEINDSGYAGILSNGNIVDRRKHSKAIPVQENKFMGIPKTKPLPPNQ